MTKPQAAAIGALAVVVLLVVPLPGEGRAVGALMDLGHAPVFGGLALAALVSLRPRLPRSPAGAIAASWVLVVLLGGATEMAQGLTGRTPDWHDLLANALGAGAALAWAAAAATASSMGRVGLRAFGAILLAAAWVQPVQILTDAARQRWEEPMLASFEHPLELSRWEFQGCRAARSRARSTAGAWSLELAMDRVMYPAATLAWPLPDWSGYAALEFDAHLDPGPPLELIVKIEDRHHDQRPVDRFHRKVRLLPGWNRTRIALADVARAPRGRRLDLRRIRRLQFFTIGPEAPRTVSLDAIRLR